VVTFSVKNRENYAILVIDGDLRLGSLAEVGQEIRNKLKGSPSSIIVNLSGVEYIDSTGMGLLVHTLHWARKNGRKMILAQLRPMVEKVFILTNLHRVFTIAKTEEEAVHLLHPRKIFLFDSREELIFFYEEIVRANHMEFGHSDNLEETIRILQEGKVDLLLLEAQENDEEKYELVRRMKKEEQLAKVPIVVLSVYEDEEFPFSQFGVERFILKPFLVEKFVAVLKQLLYR
jgi:anti-sigma B factor antagonist